MTTSDREVAAALGQAIAHRIGEPRFKLWFDGHTKFHWQDGLLVVGVPNLHFQDWLQKTFHDAVRAAALDVFGRPTEVRFQIDGELFQAARRDQQRNRGPANEDPRPSLPLAIEENASPGKADPSPDAEPAEAPRASRPRRRWRQLTEFVVGPCNRVAHAAALSVVEAPGQGGNPLVLYGPVGTGKTHLLEGISSGLRRAHPEWHICYVTAEEYTNRFVHAMGGGKLAAFRRQFRECEVLLLDDLHFLAGKARTQEEFSHTFDALLADGKQIVLTCDGHPRLEENYSPEVADRLLGGACWMLAPPDAATRLEVLRVKAVAGGVVLPDDVLQHLAARLRGNVRELEGAVHSLRHLAHVTGRRIDLALAREALGDLLRHAVRVVQLEDVERAVCLALKLEPGLLQGRKRSWAISHPRMLAMYLARKHTAASYGEIGQHFGGRNHSTAVAAEKKVRQWLQANGDLVLGERQLPVREVLEQAERLLQR